MTGPRIGSLCSGYGGLDLAVVSVLGGTVAWHAEVDPDASRVLAHHWPDVPNLGDLRAVDWAAVEPVDVLTAGYPCQPESSAGQRRSTQDERWIWPHIAAAIRHLRPGLVLLENVRGHVGRGMPTVLGDLAGMGYDAVWGCVRASDVGAPHRRERVFILAAPANTGGQVGRPLRDAVGRDGCPQARAGGAAEPGGCDSAPADPAVVGREDQPIGGDPTRLPLGTESGAGRGDRAGHPASRTPVVGRGAGVVDWGKYTRAIRRWERIVDRPAPAPLVTGARGAPGLNPALPEWMLGLPAGWVTAVPGLSRSAQLRILGNGVCPQQAELALRLLLSA